MPKRVYKSCFWILINFFQIWNIFRQICFHFFASIFLRQLQPDVLGPRRAFLVLVVGCVLGRSKTCKTLFKYFLNKIIFDKKQKCESLNFDFDGFVNFFQKCFENWKTCEYKFWANIFVWWFCHEFRFDFDGFVMNIG